MAVLNILRFPDVFPHEASCIQACVDSLKKSIPIVEIQVEDKHRGFFKKNFDEELFWVVARDWQKALRFLAAQEGHSKIFVSVLATASERLTPWETWWRSLNAPWGNHIKWISHSPLSYKFMKDLLGVPEVQLEHLPLPVPHLEVEKKTEKFNVGLFGAFIPESNFHFLLTLAHYLNQRDPSIRVRIMGSGPLASHLKKLSGDLKLGEQITIEISSNVAQVAGLDCALYLPHRNDHFSELLLAAAGGSVPISRNVQGIEKYIKDSFSGFIFDEDDTKSIAEVIVALKDKPILKTEMAKRFSSWTQAKFSPDLVAGNYLNLFRGNQHQSQNFVRCAV